MSYGFGAEATGTKESGWGQFWQNLGQNAITSLVGSVMPGVKPQAPTAPTAPSAPTAPPAPSTVVSTAKSIWPILAVAGAGVVGLVAVVVLKKRS